MKIIHAADLHLDSPLRGLSRIDGAPVETFRRATREAFSALIDLCQSEEASLLLLAGDVFDGELADFHAAAFFEKGLARLKSTGCRVAMVRGNHDAAGVLTRHLDPQPHVTLFPCDRATSIRFEDLGVVVHGQSYAEAAVSQNLAVAFPGRVEGLLNIGLLHTNAIAASAHENYAPCSLSDLCSKGYDYWALGHVHRQQVLSENPWVVYSGNLQGRHARETGPKGAMVIEIDEGKIRSVSAQTLDVVRWEIVELKGSECSGGEELLTCLTEALSALDGQEERRPTLIRVVIKGPSALHDELHGNIERWSAQIATRVVQNPRSWLERLVVATEEPGEKPEASGLVAAIAAEVQLLAEEPLLRKELAGELRALKAQVAPWLSEEIDDDAAIVKRMEAAASLLRDRLGASHLEPLL